ncbi:probable serine/threonine-protein kinase mps1 [Contarinia nasturtii]|uniref:probable serine/threonine-protein kinase mps1 n=1 Tax=Contarinia nasturtii TaxID=265458 RepID=UPI0012D48A3F|nr:probable serine/threonine-protein kinase mps1 [Contarinia nasturtii]
MSFLIAIFISILITVNAQRSPYAGVNRGSGYKDRYVPTTAVNDIENRLGEGTSGSTSTTQRLPYDAYGDGYIVNHWNSLPVEQRPFWIVNQQQIEAQRGTPPPSTVSNIGTMATRPSTNPTDFVNRFGVSGDQQQQNTMGISNAQFHEVVYPSNITPEQQLNMEIQLLQQRLDSLIQRRNQNQNQNLQPQMQQQQQQLMQQQQQLIQQQQQRRQFPSQRSF